MLTKSTKKAIVDALAFLKNIGGNEHAPLIMLNLREALEEDIVAPAAPKYFYPCIGNRGNDAWPFLPYVVSFPIPLPFNKRVSSQKDYDPCWPDTLNIPSPDGFDNESDALAYAMGRWSIWSVMPDMLGYYPTLSLHRSDIENVCEGLEVDSSQIGELGMVRIVDYIRTYCDDLHETYHEAIYSAVKNELKLD